MARDFVAGNSDHISGADPDSGYPVTIACWFNPDNLTTDNCLVSLANAGGAGSWFALEARGGNNDSVRARVNVGATVETTASYTANNWHHACGVFTNSGDVSAFLDGGNEGNMNPAATPATITVIDIGRLGDNTPSNYTEGLIAEVAVWNVSLTNAEVAVLAKGFSPLFVRPANLVFYAPMIRNVIDIKAATVLTDSGTEVGVHPRMIYPAPVQVGFEAAAAPPAAGLTGIYYRTVMQGAR